MKTAAVDKLNRETAAVGKLNRETAAVGKLNRETARIPVNYFTLAWEGQVTFNSFVDNNVSLI